jgi:hypothetical protein
MAANMEILHRLEDLHLPDKSLFTSGFSNKIYTDSTTSENLLEDEAEPSSQEQLGAAAAPPPQKVAPPLPPSLKLHIENEAKALAAVICNRDNIISSIERLQKHQNNGTFPQHYRVSVRTHNNVDRDRFELEIKIQLLRSDIQNLVSNYIRLNDQIADRKIRLLMEVYSVLKNDSRFNDFNLYWADSPNNYVITLFATKLANTLSAWALNRAEQTKKEKIRKEASLKAIEDQNAKTEKKSDLLKSKKDPNLFLLLKLEKLEKEMQSLKSGKGVGAGKTSPAPSPSIDAPQPTSANPSKKKKDKQTKDQSKKDKGKKEGNKNQKQRQQQ